MKSIGRRDAMTASLLSYRAFDFCAAALTDVNHLNQAIGEFDRLACFRFHRFVFFCRHPAPTARTDHNWLFWAWPHDKLAANYLRGGKDAFDSEPACLSSLPPVVFVLVKESSDLTLQLSCVIQLTDGSRMFKKFALDFCGKIVPLHDDCGAEAPQNMLLFVSEGCRFIAIFLRCPLWSAALVIPAGDGLVLI